jgi:hypothetical protein
VCGAAGDAGSRSDGAAAATAAEKHDYRQQGDQEQQWVYRNTPREREDQQEHYKCYEHWGLLSFTGDTHNGPMTKQMSGPLLRRT